MVSAEAPSPFRSESNKFCLYSHGPFKIIQRTQHIPIVMALPVSTVALEIFVDANPEVWFSRLRDQAHCNDLNRAKAAVRHREIFLVDLLQKHVGKPDGHYLISAQTHPSFPRVLARAMYKDKSAIWCLPHCSDITLSKEEKEEVDLTKRCRAQVETMSEYDMVRRMHEEGWIEEAGRAPVTVPGPEWQVSLREEVDEAIVSAMIVETKICQRFQEVRRRAKISPGTLPLWEELEKIEEEIRKVKLLKGLLGSLNLYLNSRNRSQSPLKVLMIDPIRAYLSATVHLFWATANLFQLASSSCLEIPKPNKAKVRSDGGGILRRYVAAVLCAEKGSQIIDAQEGRKRIMKTLKAGSRDTYIDPAFHFDDQW
ncbi:hypothetical protein GE21DRAFT_2845 [Neurospora crassa]|uniref:Uncharacterized protein n=2 Tax=Neurospora crassa TaxID=5141 RepID=Q1K5F2_NEUCR|nr:hypothetical protein NCU03411 [Neurospora crassa OR74A]EAA27622.1 hypothetical protein NCU03411 [Neurospora crassa OR74A]KHE86396.1 hypothetical protein GE21DRAFT_2845 [Neurospora crassa]CAD21124.1 hypothetical protein [Neurospora crassa]|eukprot:XP_956858.1 hypothetical protein NCU03411 [Neurospora crassa OR74A]